MHHLKTFFIGIILGISNVIPGVSGGTIAVVFNVYDRIIELISFNLSRIRKNLLFIMLLVSGLVVGVLGFSRLIDWLFSMHPVPTGFFFSGIIFGSIPFMYKKARGNFFTPMSFVFIALGLAVMIGMTFLQVDTAESTVITVLNLPSFFWLFFLGAIGAVTMLIPGISGSFILLIIGGYHTIISAISHLNIPILFPVGVGILTGLLLGASLVRFLLSRVVQITYCVILGLVLGSLFPMFQGFPIGILPVVLSLLTFGAGATLSWFFSRSETASSSAEPTIHE